jgi:transposase-like protein
MDYTLATCRCPHCGALTKETRYLGNIATKLAKFKCVECHSSFETQYGLITRFHRPKKVGGVFEQTLTQVLQGC